VAELERIIGDERDVYPINFVRRASRLSAAVGRVVVRDHDRIVAYGTGFLVARDLALTCHHVLSDAAVAGFSALELDYFEQEDGSVAPTRRLALDPTRTFVTDELLDFTVVAIDHASLDDRERATIPLMVDHGTAIVGDHVNLIHHPRGGPMAVSLRHGRLANVLDSFIHYVADTEGGSAGAPVLDDRWQLIGLHHAKRHGTPGAKWVGEAIRVKSIVAELVRSGHHELVAAAADADLSAVAEERSKTLTPRSPETSVPEVVDPSLKQPRDSIFISYAHADQDRVDWRERVRTFLGPVERRVRVMTWDDSLIRSGTDWRADIELALSRARVAILLVGPRFLSSEFIQSHELPRLLAAARGEGVTVFPVITHYAPYKLSALEPYQAFNDPDKPLEDLPRAKQNRLLNQLVEEVAAIFNGAVHSSTT
jgi:hypothetical protein